VPLRSTFREVGHRKFARYQALLEVVAQQNVRGISELVGVDPDEATLDRA